MSGYCTRARRRAAWTLIELLVVIAIVAVLAGIIFPVYARAREKARQANCISNLRQIASAGLMYADDYDGYYTRGQYAPWTSVWIWMNAIEPYVKNESVFRCRTAPGKAMYHYGYNIAYWGAGDWLDGMHGINDMVPVHESNVRMPAETLWVVDFDRYWGCGLEFGTEEPAFRHNDGTCAAFVDGHTKWLKETPERLWTINED